MLTRARRAMFGLAAALCLASPVAPHAQNAPAAAPAADPVFEAQKAAFDALSEADRKTIQESLIWIGAYVGVVDGAFGKRTRDAIVAYQTSVKAQANGLIDASQLTAMAAAAQKARAAVRFQTFVDEKSGVKIGAPMKILDKKVASDAGGARLVKSDGSASLDLLSVGGGDAGLAKLYAAAIADAPGRKIAFKISRPDYFVVSGEEGSRKFYQRVAKAPAGWSDPAALRGFRLAYPSAQSADFDKIAVAVAGSFDPFPAATAATPAATTAAASAPTPPPAPAPGKPFLAATGFLVAPGQALTAIGASDCPNPTIEGKPAKFLREDKELGLSLMSGEFSSAAAVGAPNFGALGPDLVALTYADEPTGRIALNVTEASPLPSRGSGAQSSLLASLPKSAGGSPVFDRKGALVAIVAQSNAAPTLVAGVAAIAPHRAIGADEIRRFLSDASAPADKSGEAARGAGQIAASERASVVAISCRR